MTFSINYEKVKWELRVIFKEQAVCFCIHHLNAPGFFAGTHLGGSKCMGASTIKKLANRDTESEDISKNPDSTENSTIQLYHHCPSQEARSCTHTPPS